MYAFPIGKGGFQASYVRLLECKWRATDTPAAKGTCIELHDHVDPIEPMPVIDIG